MSNYIFTIMMRVFFIFSLLSFNFAISQNQIQGKVVDGATNTSLSNTNIYNLDTKETITTGKLGQFTLKTKGTYRFKKEGYQERTMLITPNRSLILQLYLKPLELNEVIVNANQIPKALKKSVATIAILSRKEINRGNDINISQTLNRTSGIFVQSGTLNTNRLTIRGIGSRNLFGTSKIRAYFNDIPLTNGSGETTIEDFELGAIARIEIVKGATSSTHGAGLGGAIHLIPQNAYLNETSLKSQLTIGSFGLLKSKVNLNQGSTKHSFRGVYSNTHSDGYRDNNAYERQTFTLSTNHFINENNDITILASYVALKAFIPSSLNENNFINSPTKAAFTWGKAKGFEDAKRGILGITWNHRYTDDLKQVTSVFGSFKNAYEPRPFNILEENTLAFGFRSRFIGETKLFGNALNYTFGGEYFKDIYKSKTFQNLYEKFPIGTGSVKGNRLSDFKENRKYYNAFFETNYEVFKNTTLVFGLNYNQTSYDLKDQFTVSDENPNQSGNFSFNNIISPKVGISYVASKNINLYTNVSQGFSPISLAETLLPDGQINTNLKPETGWNYEIGTRGSIFKNKLQFNLAIYRLDIKNLVVARRVTNDQFIGVNAGKTRHDGLELGLNYTWMNKSPIKINTFMNYTLNNFKFKEFIEEETDFSGNYLTGVPSKVFNGGIDISTEFGFYGNINFQYVGSQPITDSNSLFSDSYNLTNLKIGYERGLSKRIKLNVFFGLDNVFNETYASQILINASSFGGKAPRYYYPGIPINYYTGLNINYTF